jgi:hypothetical protein
MIGERELLTRSLPPEGPGWAEFEARFLGKKAGCPLTADLIELAQGQAPADTAARLHSHFAECESCKNWFAAYRAGYENPAASTLTDVPSGSLLDVFSAPPRPRPAPPVSAPPPKAEARPSAPPGKATSGPSGREGFSSVVLTGIFTMYVAGRTQEALQRLRPYLPDLLEAVGLDPALHDRLWQFIGQRLDKEPDQPPLFPDWLQDFARETLSLDELPCRPSAGEWDPVLTRGALRTVQASADEPEEVRQFLQEALVHGVESAEGLDLVRLSAAPFRTGISEVECRRLIRKVRKEQHRVSRLFGMN